MRSQTALTGLRLELSHGSQSSPECDCTAGRRKKNIVSAKPELRYQRKPNQPSTDPAADFSASPAAEGMKMLVVSKLPELQGKLSLSLTLTRARTVGYNLHADLRTPKTAEGPAPLPARLSQHELCIPSEKSQDSAPEQLESQIGPCPVRTKQQLRLECNI